MNDIEEYMDAVKQGLGSAPVGADPADCADCAREEALGFGACARCRGEEQEPTAEEPPALLPHCRTCGEPRELAEDADGDCASCADALQAAGSQSADAARHTARAEALALAERTPEPPPDVVRDVAEVRWSGIGDPWEHASQAVASYERGEGMPGQRFLAQRLRLALADLHGSLDSAPAGLEHIAQRRLLRAAVGEALRGRGVRVLWAAVVTLREEV